MSKYILSIDQSTQGTKAMLFDSKGCMVARADKPHEQIVNNLGWVEHNISEILDNTLSVCREVIERSGVDKSQIVAVGICNQRETVAVWDKISGEPLHNAIVWQCSRAAELCSKLGEHTEVVKHKTGLNLSPYFSAAKISWLLQNCYEAAMAHSEGRLCCGTMDSWLIFNLTKEKAFKTDYSNASRTQLFNIRSLEWDAEVCSIFGVSIDALPEVCMSDSLFGHTDLGGLLDAPIPLCGVLGDSHGALLAQNCINPGEVKATYGTGSSVMMQTGQTLFESDNGLVTSLAWGLEGQVEYVLEGNLNYTGAVVSWMRDTACLISNDAESEDLSFKANPDDQCYFIPAFTGLGAPYWESEATAMFTGITRTTGRAELVKAGLESIGYQIADLVRLMNECSGLSVTQLRADGGPTVNRYLMQFQSDIAAVELQVSQLKELSGFGAAVAAGSSIGLYDRRSIMNEIKRIAYTPKQDDKWREGHCLGWQAAIKRVLNK